MKKSYLIAPLIACLVFGVLYFNFQRDYQTQEKAKQAELQAAKQAEAVAAIEARRKAVDAAVLAQETRQQEHDARAAAERLRQDARQAALLARDNGLREKEKLLLQIEHQKTALVTAQTAVAELNAVRQDALSEQLFLKTFLQQAEANVKALQDVVDAMSQAEAARLAAPKTNS